MRGAPAFGLADLDGLAARLASVELSRDERAVLDALIALGREAASAREAAGAAGLLVGSTPVTGDLHDVPGAFRRAFAPGARANIGNLPPHT